jgi:small subunit ribosomal protein S1
MSVDTMNELLSEYGGKDYLEVGSTIEGRLVSILKTHAVFDLNFMFDGICDLSELTQNELIIGNKLNLIVMKVDHNNGEVILSRTGIRRNELTSKLRMNEAVEIRIKEEIKGGFRVTIDSIVGFLPYSQASFTRVHDPKELIGKTVKAICIESDDKNFVFSVKKYEQILKEKEQANLISHIKQGDVYEGFVTKYVNNGVLVDIGGIVGLLALKEVSWKHIKDIKSALNIGDKIRVKVIKLDLDNKKMLFSLKDLVNDPWENVNDDYEIDEVVEGKVIKNIPSGSLVELDTGIVGYINKELYLNNRIPKPESFIDVVIIGIDKAQKKIQLKEYDPDSEYDDFDEINEDNGPTLGDLFKGMLKSK